MKSKKIDKSYLNRKNQKVRVSHFVDGDILDIIKEVASLTGSSRDKIVNALLRTVLLKKRKKKKKKSKSSGTKKHAR